MKIIKNNGDLTHVIDNDNELVVEEKDGRYNTYEVDEYGNKEMRIGGSIHKPEIEEVTGKEKEVKSFIDKLETSKLIEP